MSLVLLFLIVVFRAAPLKKWSKEYGDVIKQEFAASCGNQ
jgi:hypothetical protein